MLAAIGVPPDVSIYATAAGQYARMMMSMMFIMYLHRVRRAQYLRLSPGEQVRQHLAAGGYYP